MKLTAFVGAVLPVVAFISIMSACKPEQYEPVSSSEFKVNLELSGEVRGDANGLVNGGPITELSFGGHKIELADSMIKDGFISTTKYGKIQIKGGFNGMQLFLKPSQQRRLKELIK
jgi:hypothetical protein